MTPYIADVDFSLYVGDVRDVLRELPDGSVDCCVTSPPYLDARPEYDSLTPSEWREFFRELRRVVTGPALFNCGRLWRGGVESDWHHALLRIARREGWQKLDEVVWIKPNANPIHGRFFANRHEYVFVLGDPQTTEINVDDVRVEYAASSVARLRRGWVNHTGVKNDVGRKNGRRVSEPHPQGGKPPSYLIHDTGREKGNPHPAPMPLDLALDLVAAAARKGETVLDPFGGSGTTARAARLLGRLSILIEKDPAYADLCATRLQQLSLLAEPAA